MPARTNSEDTGATWRPCMTTPTEAVDKLCDYWGMRPPVRRYTLMVMETARSGGFAAGDISEVRADHPQGKPRHRLFSRTLSPGSDGDVTITRRDAAGFVRDLRCQDGKDICVMGGRRPGPIAC